jgi:hypothetical protein
MRGFLKYLSIALLVSVCLCTNVWSQATAQISGRVTDPTGALIPGVEVTATQTDTNLNRTAVTNETGSYVLPNLPLGPYQLSATLPGFQTYEQTGLLLQVGSSPVVNVVLEVGQVTQTIEVQANAALVETRDVGVSSIMESARLLELPLNGRALVDLVELSGAVTPAPKLDGTGGRDPFSKGNVAVAGGMGSSLNYSLDGAYHNMPAFGGYLSMPFPDALQEFKVQSGGAGADSVGERASGSVQMVTKSGTNAYHGNAFWFVRNGRFNARNSFASARDTIRRNQYGGTIGGPIIQDKLFFFAAYQGSIMRQDPSDRTAYVPTVAMMAGDFTAISSARCNSKAKTLGAPFVDNRIDPALFSRPAVLFANKLPAALDECGKTKYGIPEEEDQHQIVSRIDYQKSNNHSIFGRYVIDRINNPSPYDLTGSLLLSGSTNNAKQGWANLFALGDTFLIGPNTVNSFRLTASRVAGGKTAPNYTETSGGPAELGLKMFTHFPNGPNYRITGGWRTGWSGAGAAKTAIFGASDDLSMLRGNHQMTFGAQWVGWFSNSASDSGAKVNIRFDSMSDFLIGKTNRVTMGTFSNQNKAQTNLNVYFADVWNVTPTLTFDYGLRWAPHFPIRNNEGAGSNFSRERYDKGIKSTRFVNAPPGMLFQGDAGYPTPYAYNATWANFAPNFGLAWDVNGDGRTSLRMSGATFYDTMNVRYLTGLATSIPFATRVTARRVDFEDPWADFPGGDPFPLPSAGAVGSDFEWPPHPVGISMDYDTGNMRVDQWSLSLQRQIGDWLISGSYLGNHTIHLPSAVDINPAKYISGVGDANGNCSYNGQTVHFTVKPGAACSTQKNTNDRLELSLADPVSGLLYGGTSKVDWGSTASYNGLVLEARRQAASGVNFNFNYTWSHCITDPGGRQLGTYGNASYSDPNDRNRDRGDCMEFGSDRRHVANVTAVLETPDFSSPGLRALMGGWRLAPILKLRTGGPLNIRAGQDRALSGVDDDEQRPNQILTDPYGDKSDPDNYLNPKAFEQATLGTLGNLGRGKVHGPGYFGLDISLTRDFQFGEAQRVQFRAEAFNVTNSVRLLSPNTDFASRNFGRIFGSEDPRIMQFAFKYFF